MFLSFQTFINWIENLPVQFKTEQQKIAGLEKIKQLIVDLQLTPSVPIITVTGTNGKGSAVHATCQLLMQLGYRVASFTSPHLLSYCERIAINTQAISEKQFLAAVNQLRNQANLEEVNFFSVLLLTALTIFKQEALDYIVLEVGLGGRLDPTNALEASLVILTQVALDHTHLLGHTREAIGFEKSGLLRKKQLFVCGDANPPDTVLQKASELECQSYWLGQQFGFYRQQKYWDIWFPDRMLCHIPNPKMHPVSLSCALMAVQLLIPSKRFTATDFNQFISSLCLPARCEHAHYQGQEIIFDVAHNPAAIANLAKHLKALPDNPNTYAVFGVMADKDVASIVQEMTPLVKSWWMTTLPSPRTATAEQLAALVPHSKAFASPSTAFENLLACVPANSRIIVFGSFLTVAGVKEFMKPDKFSLSA